MSQRLLVVLLLGLGLSACSSCGGGGHNPDVDGGVDAPADAGPGETVCENLPAQADTCTVTAGSKAMLIKGNVLTPQMVFRGGQVAIDETGTITCAGCDCAKGGETTIVCPQASVSPGLINTHEHITFQQAEPYTDTGERYEDRQQWRKGLDGHAKIPATGGASGVKISWGELRYVMGGATSIVGSGGQAGLLRNLDNATGQEGMSEPPVDFETFPLGDSSGTSRHTTSEPMATRCDYPSIVDPSTLSTYDSFEPHTAEGIDSYAREEFLCQSSDAWDTTAPGVSKNLLLSKTAMIHAIGLNPADYGAMAVAGAGLIWSPRSNVTLYGDTARVTTAARLGVEIALGTDWMPTGSMNMLRELHCADELNKDYFGNYFTDKDLWQMATLNAAAVTATDDKIGMLAPDHVADIAIFAGNGKSAYRAILEAEPKDVALVMRGGKVLYGDDAAVAALGTDCDTVDVCGTGKRVCVKSELGKTYTELQAAVGTIYPAFACGQPTKEPSCLPKRPTSVAGSTIYTGTVTADDSDGDGIANASDNCPSVFNPIRPVDNGAQGDADNDMIGDACDACPLDPGTTNCSVVDPNDRDHDGIANTADNCPEIANPNQTDGDQDGKGDACDPCPSDSNPGTAGCPSTIYKIKMGMVANGTSVRIQNALVTGKGSNGFFVQTKEGDAGYMGSAYSGLFIFTGPMAPTLNDAVVGLRVTIDGTVATFQNQLELTSIGAVIPETMTGEAPPAPIAATYVEVKTGGSKATALESVLVQVSASAVTATNPTFGEYTLTSGADALIVDDFLYVPTPAPGVGAQFMSVTGILALRQMASKLEPRSATDVVAGPPILSSLAPAPAFVRVGTTNGYTIPAGSELTVTLSGPAQGDTDVTVTSSNTSALQIVGGKVTVMNGMTSAKVAVNALAQNAAVTVTAQLGSGTPVTAQLRVLGATESPTVVALAPTSIAVAPAGTITLTVSLDIPAPPGGTTVNLAVNPSAAGTTNPAGSITIPADTLAATLTYTDAAGSGSATVTATLGSSMATSTITVSSGASHLVINEIDYDQVNTDNAEYVEIYNPTGAAVSLANVALVLINGANGQAYPTATSTIDLSTAGSIPAFGYLVVAGSNIAVNPPALKIDPGWTSDAVQNGSPDGVALVDTSAGTLIDALSYEGQIVAAEVPGIANPVSLVEGTALSTAVVDTNTAVGALCRSPNGKDTDNANADWHLCTTITPGSANP